MNNCWKSMFYATQENYNCTNDFHVLIMILQEQDQDHNNKPIFATSDSGTLCQS